MPYLSDKERAFVDDVGPSTPGQLNYAITKVVLDYMSIIGVSYSNLNEAYGAMLAAAAEFYRRKVAPYEDDKAKENGDVYA
jgi:hypothetical protein